MIGHVRLWWSGIACFPHHAPVEVIVVFTTLVDAGLVCGLIRRVDGDRFVGVFHLQVLSSTVLRGAFSVARVVCYGFISDVRRARWYVGVVFDNGPWVKVLKGSIGHVPGGAASQHRCVL